MLKRYRIRDYDFKLILMVLAISLIGVLTIGSAEAALQKRQLAGVVAGTVVMIVLSFFDYSMILRLNWLIYGLNLALLLMVYFMGKSSNNAQRWLEIGGLRFQPSETAKILLILFFAQYIMKHKEKINSLRILISCVVLFAVPWVLVYKQPDLSTSIVLLILFAIIMFAGGISYKLVLGALAVMIPAVIIIVTLAFQPDTENDLLKPYQKQRIMAFFYPDEYASTTAYQQLNSRMAIASGQLDGKGYKNNEITSVKNGNFVSEAETDFIFAVIGEELGFKGSAVVIVLLMGISLECLTAARKAKDIGGTIIAAGVGGWVGFQAFINMGVATLILPNTGLPLPFVSYGLTSLMSLYIGMGFVLNVRLQPKRSS